MSYPWGSNIAPQWQAHLTLPEPALLPACRSLFPLTLDELAQLRLHLGPKCQARRCRDHQQPCQSDLGISGVGMCNVTVLVLFWNTAGSQDLPFQVTRFVKIELVGPEVTGNCLGV